MTGVSWRPPPPHRLAQRCAGRSLGGGGRALGVPARRWGGVPAERLGGRRRPVKVTDSRERRPGELSSGGHRPGRRRRTNEDDSRVRVNIPTCATHRLENKNASVQVLLF